MDGLEAEDIENNRIDPEFLLTEDERETSDNDDDFSDLNNTDSEFKEKSRGYNEFEFNGDIIEQKKYVIFHDNLRKNFKIVNVERLFRSQ